MSNTVTFSFNSTKYENVKATETFTFETLGIDVDDEASIEKVFQAWVWDQLNLSFSIVIDEDKRT